ncbi:UNVERIFIED_CONTAM: hypothetical protein FKN15_013309 [Acipenser sinensis]
MGEMSAILARRRKATDKGEKVVPKKEEESTNDDSDSTSSKPLGSSDSIRRPWEKAATMPRNNSVPKSLDSMNSPQSASPLSRVKSVTTSSNSTEGPSPDDSDLDRMKQVQHRAQCISQVQCRAYTHLENCLATLKLGMDIPDSMRIWGCSEEPGCTHLYHTLCMVCRAPAY